ncbi:MAG: hypothetical protein ABR915_05820 [Thermoguttaceae bacterium]
MDNLVHASASDDEAQREIKLWFRPNDIMPYMQAYPTASCQEHYYYRDGKLQTTYEPGSRSILAPGETAWASDLEALGLLAQGKAAACTLDAVVAKYLINERRDLPE